VSEETIAYIVHANRESPIFLCVMDRDNEKYHKFEISPLIALRLATESLDAVNSSVGYSEKQSLQEAFRALVAK
jgi:hypothetical protein